MLPRFDRTKDLGPFDDRNSDRYDRLSRQEPASKARTFTIVRTRREAVMCGSIFCVRGVTDLGMPPARIGRIAPRTTRVESRPSQ